VQRVNKGDKMNFSHIIERSSTDASIKCYSSNIIEASIRTTGPQGGDAGHGGRSVLTIEAEPNTHWVVTIDGKEIEDPKTLKIMMLGDTEMETFQGILDFVAAEHRRLSED
jgi:hypothetical protein